MLEKITLRNFQRFDRFTLELSAGLTVLVGDSRAGKSSVLRFLRWCCLGGPATGYTKFGEDSLRGTLHFDGHRLTRRRGKGKNTYSLGEKEFSAVSTSVPEEVASLLGVSEINFQSQLDPPFWLSLSPGEAARELNKVVSLDLIDSSLSNASAALRKAVAREELCRERLTKCEGTIKDLSWVPDADKDLQALEGMESSLDALSARESRLSALISDIKGVRESVRGSAKLLKDAERLEKSLGRVTMLSQREDRLRHLIDQYREEGESRCRSLTELAGAEAEMRAMGEDACPLCGRKSPE